MYFRSYCKIDPFILYCLDLRDNTDLLSNKKDRFDALHLFLDQYNPASIDPAAAASLDAPLTEEEFKLALGAMKLGKSPRPHSFTGQYFKSFTETLFPHCLAAFNSSADNSFPVPS